MTIAEIMGKMIVCSQGNQHDMDHFIRVWTYARTIGKLEGLDECTQFILEAAAIVHDIACPLCREKYGNTNGRNQEKEGVGLTQAFFAGTDVPEAWRERIAFLVGHHHTLRDIAGLDWQILVEADYIANALENGYPEGNIKNVMETIMKTSSGKRLCREVTGKEGQA